MDRRRIEVKTISCKGLGSRALFRKPSISVAVSLSYGGAGRRQQRQKAPVDKHGGRNPEWDHAMRFDLPGVGGGDLLLEFELRDHGRLHVGGKKVVGRAAVLVGELLAAQATGPTDVDFRFVSYQVRSPRGRAKGVLTFAYQLVDAGLAAGPPPRLPQNVPAASAPADQKPSPAAEDPEHFRYPPAPEAADSLYPRLSPKHPASLYPRLLPESTIAHPLPTEVNPAYSSRLNPPIHVPESRYSPPAFPTAAYTPVAAYPPAAVGWHYGNYAPPPGGHVGFYTPPDQLYRSMMNGYDRGLHGFSY